MGRHQIVREVVLVAIALVGPQIAGGEGTNRPRQLQSVQWPWQWHARMQPLTDPNLLRRPLRRQCRVLPGTDLRSRLCLDLCAAAGWSARRVRATPKHARTRSPCNCHCVRCPVPPPCTNRGYSAHTDCFQHRHLCATSCVSCAASRPAHRLPGTSCDSSPRCGLAIFRVHSPLGSPRFCVLLQVLGYADALGEHIDTLMDVVALAGVVLGLASALFRWVGPGGAHWQLLLS